MLIVYVPAGVDLRVCPQKSDEQYPNSLGLNCIRYRFSVENFIFVFVKNTYGWNIVQNIDKLKEIFFMNSDPTKFYLYS